TRLAYPIDFVENAVESGMAGHPEAVMFLTADSFGVLPPISKLTTPQAMYYFLSGYTSKLAGTEAGVTTPQATFSSCFGAAILPLRPGEQDSLLTPRNTWEDKEAYDRQAAELSERFKKNCQQFAPRSGEVRNAGPR